MSYKKSATATKVTRPYIRINNKNDLITVSTSIKSLNNTLVTKWPQLPRSYLFRVTIWLIEVIWICLVFTAFHRIPWHEHSNALFTHTFRSNSFSYIAEDVHIVQNDLRMYFRVYRTIKLHLDFCVSIIVH